MCRLCRNFNLWESVQNSLEIFKISYLSLANFDKKNDIWKKQRSKLFPWTILKS